MRIFYFLVFFSLSLWLGAQNADVSLESEGKTEGIVTTKFKKKGCGSLVMIVSGGKKIYLMPKSPLEKEFDKNKLRIKFTYRRLRMPSPANCEFCYMVELKEVEKK
ncbi:MAG TPA: hypothetical protein PLC65_05595 [Bacteroidia bacterium]|nr:hypothetical protein [Bacteroidia bacterium]HRD38084.1 hypothetical protein [Bacteroidia bacterium]